MSAAEDDADPQPPLTVEQLADLQAGLLDDDTAAAVRSRIRTDPQAADALQALHQVRRDLAALAAEPAPNAPPQLVDSVAAALRSPGAAHAARPPMRSARVIAGLVGFAGVVAAIGLGTAALLRSPSSGSKTDPTANHITVSAPVPVIPLSDPEILALLHRPPDFGALTNPGQRASCLGGLGYPAGTPILGAQPVEVNSRPGVLLVMAGDTPGTVTAYAVALSCSAADTGLLATTTIPRA
ncbi:hypothetical protein [Mycobacterium vicinigordonae]|uniref:Anti-sigma-M factor RsmA n=1 Tax=Mycobacterium vicinigordonae TaxID=1719132 RepID=A0A7D6I0W2_9MYCO|nr:hypothetical protein [Mycobacterium vicinigordonae]QLL07454.1 hypothetical protein H0P51_28135 [Mycobacterium vicinigordonae]